LTSHDGLEAGITGFVRGASPKEIPVTSCSTGRRSRPAELYPHGEGMQSDWDRRASVMLAFGFALPLPSLIKVALTIRFSMFRG
jgi:hypothetical protein